MTHPNVIKQESSSLISALIQALRCSFRAYAHQNFSTDLMVLSKGGVQQSSVAACCRFPEPARWREPPWDFDGGVDLRSGVSEAGSVAESSTTAAGCGMKAAAGCRSPKRLLPPLLSRAYPRSSQKSQSGHPAPNAKRIKKPSERNSGLFNQRGIGWLVPHSHEPFHVRLSLSRRCGHGLALKNWLCVHNA